MAKFREIGKYISILQRLNNMHFLNEMNVYQIGCGQQFFLLRISEYPGITLQELAAFGYYDKATATRAVQKLEEEGCVRIETDERDKRVRHIYVTEKAMPVLERTWEVVDLWEDYVLDGFSEEERKNAVEILARMAANAHDHLIG